MWLHGRGGAPFLMIFELSMMHLVTASKQFISYRSLYTNFTSLSLIRAVAPGALLYRSGWSAARGVRRGCVAASPRERLRLVSPNTRLNQL
jgi:hypothetical protein